MENKEEIKDTNFINREAINTSHETSTESVDIEGNVSPFKIYEEKYCNKCEDYRGCLGLIDSMTVMLQDSKSKTGNEGLDSMVKSIGGLTFSARFKMILDCSKLRSYISKMCI